MLVLLILTSVDLFCCSEILSVSVNDHRPGAAIPNESLRKKTRKLGMGRGSEEGEASLPFTFFQCSDDGMPAPRCSLCAPRRLGAIGVVRTRWNGRVEAGATGRLWRR